MKTTKEKIEVMQAYDRGEQIQIKGSSIDWIDIIDIVSPKWDCINYDYRVKPKKNFVPFEKAEEFLEAQRNHGETIRCKSDDYLFRSFVNGCGDISLVNDDGYSLSENIGDIYGRYEFLDGTPCGKEVVL